MKNSCTAGTHALARRAFRGPCPAASRRLCRSTASVVLPRRREGRRGSLRPRQIDRASAKRVRCQESSTRETLGCVALFVTQGLRPRKANASSEMCKHCQRGFRYLREAHDRTTARWPTAPWMLARASAKRIKHCQCGCNTKNTRMRCSFRNTRASPTKSQRICEAHAMPGF